MNGCIMDELQRVKQEILEALRHEEADEGLYFSNLYELHEEDERSAVSGDVALIEQAVKELVSEGRITIRDDEGAVVLTLVR